MELNWEKEQKMILRFLEQRLGMLPDDLIFATRQIRKDRKPRDLVDWAFRCRDLESYRARLHARFRAPATRICLPKANNPS
jgi:hypothetical protein